MTAKRPNSMRHLDDAIRRECGGNQAAYVRMRTLMANAVVAGMLPDGVVKGGSAIKTRYGNARTRYTPTSTPRPSPTPPPTPNSSGLRSPAAGRASQGGSSPRSPRTRGMCRKSTSCSLST